MAARCAWRWEASLAPAAAYGAGTDESGCGGRVTPATSHGGRGDGTNRRAPPWDWGRAAPDPGVGRVDPAAATKACRELHAHELCTTRAHHANCAGAQGSPVGVDHGGRRPLGPIRRVDDGSLEVVMWDSRSYLPRRTRMSIRHLTKLEVLRSNMTGTWVRTLATCTAGKAEVGMVELMRAPAVVELEAGREGR